MSARTFLLGMNAKAYQGAAGAALAALSEMANVKDVSLNLEAGEADVTTRANNGWRANAATLRECAAEFEMLWKPGDLIFQAVKKAYLTSGTIRMAFLTGAIDGEDAEGPVGDFSIPKFSRNEPLEEGDDLWLGTFTGSVVQLLTVGVVDGVDLVIRGLGKLRQDFPGHQGVNIQSLLLGLRVQQLRVDGLGQRALSNVVQLLLGLDELVRGDLLDFLSGDLVPIDAGQNFPRRGLRQEGR